MANRTTLLYRGAIDLTKWDIIAGRVCLGLLIPSLSIGLTKATYEICVYAVDVFADAWRLVSAIF